MTTPVAFSALLDRFQAAVERVECANDERNVKSIDVDESAAELADARAEICIRFSEAQHQEAIAQAEIAKLMASSDAKYDSIPRWIPVSERAPDEEGRYAILYRYKDTNIVKAFIGDFFGDGWNCNVAGSTITHWMPLPEAPTK